MLQLCTVNLLDRLQKRVKHRTHKTAFKNGLSLDWHMMFETCGRHQELDSNINLKSVYFVVSRCIIVSQCAVQSVQHSVQKCRQYGVPVHITLGTVMLRMCLCFSVVSLYVDWTY